MLIEECSLPISNPLIKDYISGNSKATSLFEYDYRQAESYVLRRDELLKQSFPRAELVSHLISFNQRYSSEQKVFENIEKLTSEECTVVITGQQAGLFTGPLYTIYKAISVIQLAKKFEEDLQTPVVPIFWVAGEDHDFQEVNHVWLEHEGKLTKHMYPMLHNDKRSVTNIPVYNENSDRWIEEIFESFGETAYTEELLTIIKEKVRASANFTDFFIHLMSFLLGKYGLVFVDSANTDLRKIESTFFNALIRKNTHLQAAFSQQTEALTKAGYEATIEVEPSCAHLFYHLNGQRELLHRSKDGLFYIHQHEMHFTEDELVQVSLLEPEKLSNNVVTRPLMQEFLFPTLAYVGGPGELAYWAQLKPLFKEMGLQMPPVIPRMHATIIEREIVKLMHNYEISPIEAITTGVNKYKNEWLEKQKDHTSEQIIAETVRAIDQAHEPLRQFAWELDQNLGRIAEKNRELILDQITFMQKRIDQMYTERFAHDLASFQMLESRLFPNGGRQERTWNIFYYLNRYSLDFIEQLFQIRDTYKNNHFLLYL